MGKWYDEAARLKPYIEKGVQHLDDSEALKAKTLYPHWASDVSYANGTKLQYDKKLWRVVQAHTSQPDWTPDKTPALFERIDETHAGTREDPIPYEGNMIIFDGLYYTENGVLYLCTRDSDTPLYHSLSALVGIYVEVIA